MVFILDFVLRAIWSATFRAIPNSVQSDMNSVVERQLMRLLGLLQLHNHGMLISLRFTVSMTVQGRSPQGTAYSRHQITFSSLNVQPTICSKSSIFRTHPVLRLVCPSSRRLDLAFRRVGAQIASHIILRLLHRRLPLSCLNAPLFSCCGVLRMGFVIELPGWHIIRTWQSSRENTDLVTEESYRCTRTHTPMRASL